MIAHEARQGLYWLQGISADVYTDVLDLSVSPLKTMLLAGKVSSKFQDAPIAAGFAMICISRLVVPWPVC